MDIEQEVANLKARLTAAEHDLARLRGEPEQACVIAVPIRTTIHRHDPTASRPHVEPKVNVPDHSPKPNVPSLKARKTSC
jgi:hypothetical protein